MGKRIKKIIGDALLALSIKKQEIVPSKEITTSNNTDLLTQGTVSGVANPTPVEKEQKWFTEANDLVAAFKDEEPIVYSSNLSNPWVRKQDQYGYDDPLDKLRPKEDEEKYADDIDDMLDIDRSHLDRKSNTAKYDEKGQFEHRFKEIEAQVDKEREELMRKDQELEDELRREAEEALKSWKPEDNEE